MRNIWQFGKKHSDKALNVICEDYFQYDFGTERWEAVISFESLHHFLPEQKEKLYGKICKSLKKEAVFVLGDYIACCNEEEELLRTVYLEKREKCMVPEDYFVHFHIPLTLEHELELLEKAGFSGIEAIDCTEEAVIIVAKNKI